MKKMFVLEPCLPIKGLVRSTGIELRTGRLAPQRTRLACDTCSLETVKLAISCQYLKTKDSTLKKSFFFSPISKNFLSILPLASDSCKSPAFGK